MAQLIDLYFTREKLDTMLKTMTAKAAAGDEKAGKGLSITVSVNDEVRGDYNQNVSAWVAQSKEDRDANKGKYYVANGKTFWSDNGAFIPGKEAPAPAAATSGADVDDLPF